MLCDEEPVQPHISHTALSTGARAVTVAEAAREAEVLIVLMPMNRNTDIAVHVRSAPEGAGVIDTSNCYLERDGVIDAFESGQPESVWVSKLFGRPVAKAWNAILSQSFD